MTITTVERPTAPAPVPVATAVRQGVGALSLSAMSPAEVWGFCERLADTPLLPDAYRRNPSSILWALEYGRALNLDVVTTITTIHVIKGRPTQSADLMLSRTRAAGHRVRIRQDEGSCTASIWRADDPEFENRVTWTYNDAVTAGLCTLPNGRPYSRSSKGEPQAWEKYPRAMLRARAISECVRSACPEVLHGAIYTPEELGAVIDQDGNPVAAPEPGFVRQQPGADEWSQAAPARPAAEQQTPAESWDAAAEDDISGARDWITEATEAADADAVRALWREAQGAGAVPATLDAVGRIGVAKAAAEKQAREAAAEPPAPAGPEGTLPGAPAAPSDRMDALAGLYAAGEAAGLSPDETRRVLAEHCGRALPDATAQDIAACTADLTRAGGAA